MKVTGTDREHQVLAYGWVAEGANVVVVRFEDSLSESLVVSGVLWAIAVPDSRKIVSVTHWTDDCVQPQRVATAMSGTFDDSGGPTTPPGRSPTSEGSRRVLDRNRPDSKGIGLFV